MTLIQFILLVLLLLLILLYSRLLLHELKWRIALLFVFLLGILAVVFPQYTTVVANRLGVGRGADLLLYLLVVISYFAWAFLYQKIRHLEQQQTAIIREMTLFQANRAEPQKVDESE